MEAVNFFKKREGVFPLIASLIIFLLFFPQISLSEQGVPPRSPEEKPITESGLPLGSHLPLKQAQLQQQKDVTPPKLVNILVIPETLSVTVRPVPITVTLQLTDEGSGVKEWEVFFTGPSGTKNLTISGNPGLATGSTLKGIFQGTSLLPEFSEAGVWYATLITITDNAGNTAKINLTDAGFPLSFVLTQPKKPLEAPTTEAEKAEQAVPVIPPVQEQPLSQAPADISPPAKDEKAIIKEEQVVPEKPPVPEQAQSPTTEAPPPAQVPEKKIAEEEKTVPEGPPIMLTLRQAIKIALAGNRPYLDRLDAIRQNQGLGQVAGSVQIIQTSGGDLQIPVSATSTSGLAAAEAAFQPTLSPTFSITRDQVTPQVESYGLAAGKQFITGGRLDLRSTTASTQFEKFSSSLTANFSQPLLRGAWPFVVGEPIAFAKSQLYQAQFNALCCEDSSQQGVIFNVISQYYGIKNQMELVEISKKAVERAERLYKATEAKQKVELSTQLDMSRAEVQLSTQEVNYNQAVQDLGNKQETFKVLLGLNSRETIELTDEIVYQPSEEIIKEEDLPKFIETAVKNRPDLKAQQLRIGDSDRRLRIARNSLLPDLDTSYSYQVSNIGGLNGNPGANSKIWSATISLSYPLPLTNTKINIEQNAVQLKRDERAFVEKKESIKKDVNNDLRNVVKLQEQIPIVKAQIESAEKKLKIANFRFDRGLASNFDIVDAENNLIQARQNLTKSIADYLVAKNQLKRDIGALTED